MSNDPTINTPPRGRTIAADCDVDRFLATGGDTHGRYAIREAVVPPGGGPPPHAHSREEEGFCVLDGEVTVHVGEERVVATAGVFVNMPAGTPHGFKNEGGRPVKMLISVAPAGLGQMFFEVGVPVAAGVRYPISPPSVAQPDDRRRHELQFRVGRGQCVAVEDNEADVTPTWPNPAHDLRRTAR